MKKFLPLLALLLAFLAEEPAARAQFSGRNLLNYQGLYSYIGYPTGSAVISGGAVRSTSASTETTLFLGYYQGYQGTVDVTGDNSSWTLTGPVWDGYFGQGSVTVESGGFLSANGIYLAYGSNSTGAASMGTLIVRGQSSTGVQSAVSGGSFSVGVGGSGSIQITAGGVATGSATNLYGSGSNTSTLTVSGTTAAGLASSFNGGALSANGNATITVSLGGSATFGNSVLGGTAGAGTASLLVTGKSAVTGADSLVVMNGSGGVGNYVDLGGLGAGAATLSNGGELRIGSASAGLYLGAALSGNGVLNLGAASGSAAAAPGRLDTSAVIQGGPGRSAINFNLTNSGGAPYLFTNDAGAGNSIGVGIAVNVLAGVTEFTIGNDYSGGTSVSGGTLILADTGGPGGVMAYGDGEGPLTIGAGGTVQVGTGGASGTLYGTGTIADNGALVFDRSDAVPVLNVIAGAGSVAQQGGGTLTLWAANTYSGGTMVSAGTLTAANASALGTGLVTVNGGTLNLGGQAVTNAVTISGGGQLAGRGSVGSLTLQRGGVIAPGNSPGTITAANATLLGGSVFQWQINSAAGSAGRNWDLLNVSGNLNRTGAGAGNPITVALESLTLGNAPGDAANFNPNQNQSFVFLSAGSVAGDSAADFTVDASGFSNGGAGVWSVTESGNDLELNYAMSAVPEPATYAIILGAAALGFAVWRRVERVVPNALDV